MSGLEKFQDNPAWRQKLINHLLMERPQPTAPKVKPESMERRHSLGIVLDFPTLIKARKAELEAQQQREKNTTSAVDLGNKVENLCKMSEDMPNQNVDDSFAAFERMCDKTASDPDSTLFHYLHSEDKDQVLAVAKERSSRSENFGDRELESLQRMIADVNDQAQLSNESPLKSADCTQLEDVEAPSRFWDNDSLMNGGTDSIFQPTAETSPVKMVGLLRPSTILEASEADLTGLPSEESSQDSSFQTAHTLKTDRGGAETSGSGSSCYETAADSSLTSSSKEAATLSVDDLFYAAIAKAKPHGMSKCEQEELLIDLQETLMDLAVNDANEDTVIELSSSSDEEKAGGNVEYLQTEIKEEFSLVDSDTEDGKENNSGRLNGTMEEMEYMLRKAEEYMSAHKKTSSEPSVEPNVIHLHQKPAKQKTFVLSPKKMTLTPGQPMTSSKPRYDINMKIPKNKFFKEPSSIPTRLQPKLQKDNFAHIVSPIRTYTQKSGTAPLMSMFREKPKKINLLDLEEESFLNQIKRGQTETTGIANPPRMNAEWFNPAARFLPKKAYISSEIKQVVDERTPFPMPSVPKIQKYLDSAAEPTVLRHDGKLKMSVHNDNNSSRGFGDKNISHIPRRRNQSLADLSVASGDISLYTLKNAQKF